MKRSIETWRYGGYLHAAAAMLLLLAAGCSPRYDVPSDYARERRTGSIQGLEVLTDMLAAKKCTVRSYGRLSPGLRKQDVVIWFADDFGPPPDQALWFLEDWLSRRANRLVVVVGRDYDAGVDYWREVIGQMPPDKREIALRRLAEAQMRSDLARAKALNAYSNPWLRFERSSKLVRVTKPQGPWAQGVDFLQANLAYQSKLLPPPEEVAPGQLYDPVLMNPERAIEEPPEQATTPTEGPTEAPDGEPIEEPVGEPAEDSSSEESDETAKPSGPKNPYRLGRTLLEEGGMPFAFEVVSDRFPGSRIVVVQNARFLVNYGLVNREHRKLAGHLLAEIPASANVAILHSEKGGPQVYWGQVHAEKSKPEEVLPQIGVLLQLTLPALLLLFVLYPVFGRARDLPRVQISDFGKHIQAIGALLQKGGDERYAWSRVFAYQQQFRRESGARHSAKRSETTKRMIVLQVAATALGVNRAMELGVGNWLETHIASRKIGKVALKVSQPHCLEIHMESEDAEFSRAAIESLLREGRLFEQTTLFIR